LLKWGTLGSNRLKCAGHRWAPNLLKSVALAPGVLKCGAALTPHRRAPPQKGLRSTPRAKLLKSAPRRAGGPKLLKWGRLRARQGQIC
jgi:hypothetical protein